MSQFTYFISDIKRMLGKHKIRILYVWLSRSFWGILLYRTERSLFLVFGTYYSFIRVPLVPLFNMLQAYSNIDIHYKADVKKGISILHPSVGVVISGQSSIGENLTLTGGNVIGVHKKCKKGTFVIGNNCSLGANATIIGPIILGDNIIIGASACVVENCLIPQSILVGVPAKTLPKNNN
jgi:serine acetyltransferase